MSSRYVSDAALSGGRAAGESALASVFEGPSCVDESAMGDEDAHALSSEANASAPQIAAAMCMQRPRATRVPLDEALQIHGPISGARHATRARR